MNDCFKGLFHFAPADHSRTARETNQAKKLPNDRVAREPFENPFSPELPPQRFAWGRERFSRSRMKRSFY